MIKERYFAQTKQLLKVLSTACGSEQEEKQGKKQGGRTTCSEHLGRQHFVFDDLHLRCKAKGLFFQD